MDHDGEQPERGERENERGHVRLRLHRRLVREQGEALERPGGRQPHSRAGGGALGCRDHRVEQVCLSRPGCKGGAVGRELGVKRKGANRRPHGRERPKGTFDSREGGPPGDIPASLMRSLVQKSRTECPRRQAASHPPEAR